MKMHPLKARTAHIPSAQQHSQIRPPTGPAINDGSSKLLSAARPGPGRLRLLFGICLSVIGSLAIGQFAVERHTIGGGGGTSTGGPFSVTGTIGQPAAGPLLAGGSFTVAGGFWALPVAIQITNGPTLSIAMGRGDTAVISWAPEMPGFTLQEAWTPSGEWSNSPSGDANPASVPIVVPAKFYRLHKP